ncbi:MAG: YeeE/YedE family protein [Motiliproteus sp.]|nr:YeeE/YedE family protein [Motiliproteus sp.]MCW9053973.1 YeeE/YedE family protein [Motiliproteus sp.]
MKKPIAALFAGVLFGLGVSLAEMIDPARVVGFLNLAGAWDPTLALVMIGALGVNIPATSLILDRNQPLLDRRFHLPSAKQIDLRLIAGSVLFGIGWGLAGYCPGPLLASVSFVDGAIIAMLAAYLMGTVIARWLMASVPVGTEQSPAKS